jgi:DNA-directed RNA polymerase specialized sigma24 family protein
MFASTRWSLIAAASHTATPEARQAMAQLCEAYWFPIYAYVRRRGNERHLAEDLTQTFFYRLLETNDLAMADQARGRFRTFLLTACQHFLANQHDFATAQRRGGNRSLLSLDFDSAEGKFHREPATNNDSAERLFERRWALELLDRALIELQTEYTESGRGKLFDCLKTTLSGEPAMRMDQLADELNMTIGSVKVATHRLRQRYRDRIREIIARTVSDESEIDEEIRNLFHALG